MSACGASLRVLLSAAVTLYGGGCLADPPPPKAAEFAWRAPLQVPAGTSVARVGLPAQALLRLQSSDARDIRIYNGAGEAVAFARMGAPGMQEVKTASLKALPLYSAPPDGSRPNGSVQVRVDAAGGQQSVFVRLDGTEVPAAPKLDAALFATRDEKRLLGALDVEAAIPANTPVQVSVSSSADLAQWTSLAVRGRLYRFQGEGAPANMRLEFEQPAALEGRYLRLDWHGQPGVTVASVSGVVAPAARAPVRVRAELPAPQAAGSGAVEIATGFLTPMAGLALSTPRPNSLLPVRILGRSEVSEPWRLLARTAVYRLGTSGGEAANPPEALHGASARWLRIESTNGIDLAAAGLQASVEFAPMQLVFLATGAGPFELAVGRVGTPAAALPLSLITSALGSVKIEDLPAVEAGPAVIQVPAEQGLLAKVWPSTLPRRTALLWAVLLGGVLLLAGVALSLLRQLKASTPPQP